VEFVIITQNSLERKWVKNDYFLNIPAIKEFTIPFPLVIFHVDPCRNLGPCHHHDPSPDLYRDPGLCLFPCLYLDLIRAGKFQG
jgi:hypothetical protein